MEYNDTVNNFEKDLANYAMKSFDSDCFVDGKEVYKYYIDLWNGQGGKEKLNNRTPIQHQRDKILYSKGIRKQSEKYHILYSGGKRIIRNYITHTMRKMQVIRTICRALRLNEDFAEALALGSKIGASSFIHASKNKISSWMIKKIDEIAHSKKGYSSDLFSETEHSKQICSSDHPDWVKNVKNIEVFEEIKKYIPFACGERIEDPAYSSGKQSYWLLATNPYTMVSHENSYTPEIMYGIWRHSIENQKGDNSFKYQQKINEANHKIEWKNITFESIVLRYADDITWVIENLNDANDAKILNEPSKTSYYNELLCNTKLDLPIISSGLSQKDSGKLYSYFINDFINNSSRILGSSDSLESKMSLKNGDSKYMIGLSSEGLEILNTIKEFLMQKVFKEDRVLNRKRMLGTITEGCVDLIYNSKNDYLRKYIETKAVIEGWSDDLSSQAINLLDQDIHRIQVAVNVFSELSDQEIFSFVGMESF